MISWSRTIFAFTLRCWHLGLGSNLFRLHSQQMARPEFKPRHSEPKVHTSEHHPHCLHDHLLNQKKGHSGCRKAVEGDENWIISHQSPVGSWPCPRAWTQGLPSILSGLLLCLEWEEGGHHILCCWERNVDTALLHEQLLREKRKMTLEETNSPGHVFKCIPCK